MDVETEKARWAVAQRMLRRDRCGIVRCCYRNRGALQALMAKALMAKALMAKALMAKARRPERTCDRDRATDEAALSGR